MARTEAGMKVVVTLDGDAEAFLQEQVAFHLAAGADDVLVTDEILDDPAAGHEADWVIESRAAEFWWPRGSSLRQILAAVPPQYGAVEAIARHFVPVAGDEAPFYERMIYRRTAPAVAGDPFLAPWVPARRTVRRGAHSQHRSLRGWYPVEVLRFPVLATPTYDIERGLAEGLLREDTRFRDAMRAIVAGDAPEFPPPSAVEEALFAADIALLGGADVIHVHRRLDDLEERLSAVESTLPAMFKRRLRALLRRAPT